MITREDLTGVMQRCLEKRADGRFYPTPAGCIRLQEMLSEKGLNVKVSISDDQRFELSDPLP